MKPIAPALPGRPTTSLLLVGLLAAHLPAPLPAQTVLFAPNGGAVGASSTSGVGVGTTNPLAGTLQVSNGGDLARLVLLPHGGANNREALVDFWATFDNFPADTSARRAGRIQVGFDAGVWGSEYMAFGVGGATDAANPPSEVMRLRNGGGGSLKVRMQDPLYLDDYFALQTGGPIESMVNDGSSFIRFYDPSDRVYSAGYNRGDYNFRISMGGSPADNVDFVMNYFGHVGLGVSNPAAQLDVLSPDPAIARFFGSTSNNQWVTVANGAGALNIGLGASSGTLGVGYLWSNTNKVMIGSDGAPTLFVDGMSGGKVGIGTTTPGTRLSLGATTQSRLLSLYDDAFAWYGFGIESYQMRLQVGDPAARFSFLAGDTNEIVTFLGSGKVGIGTADPSHTLSVNGAIKTREVIVEVTGWADHVFAPDHRLAPLSEVEAHIRAAGHLPGIPSAAEVAEQGVSLGDMQVRLLGKVEELTLHLIELHKANAALAARVGELEAGGVR